MDIMDRALQEQRLQDRVTNWERLTLPRLVREHGQGLGVAKLREQREAFLRQVRAQQPKPPGTTTTEQPQEQQQASYNSSMTGGQGTTYTAGQGGALSGGATGGGYGMAASSGAGGTTGYGTGIAGWSAAGETGGAYGAGAAGGSAGAGAGAGAGGGAAAGGATAGGGGATAGGAGAAGGGGGALAGTGPIGLFAALIASGKLLEERNSQSPVGRALLSGLGPSANQASVDPKLGIATAAGGAFMGGAIRNKKASEQKPEWAELAEGKTPTAWKEMFSGRTPARYGTEIKKGGETVWGGVQTAATSFPELIASLFG